MSNGGVLGSRNAPRFDKASGVWQLEEAYHADRDGIWPRWPEDSGMPFSQDLLYWCEADYGLYKDEAATQPAISDGDPVRAWVNRGGAGIVKVEPTSNPMILRTNAGRPYLETNGAVTQVNYATLKTNVYAFHKLDDIDAAIGTLLADHDPATGLVRAVRQLGSISTPAFYYPAAAATGLSVVQQTTFAKNGVLTANISTNPQLGGNGRQTRYYNSVSSYTLNSTISTMPTLGLSIATAIRAIGFKSSGGVLSGSNFKIKALVLYSTNEPLTEAQVNAIADYLGGKWGHFLLAGSFG
jgi:hypothetical protein